MRGIQRVLGVGLVACGGVILPATAQDAPSFKRVVPGGEVPGARITIQVAPPPPETPILGHSVDVPDAPTPLPGGGPQPEIGETAEWFWAAISPELGAAHPRRLEQAREVVAATRPNTIPAQTRLETILSDHGVNILTQSAPHAVSPALVLAVMSVESAGQAEAVSSAGAVGLMQLMPQTAARFDVTDRTDPAQSIAGGAAYLAWLLEEFRGDAPLALAAYNAGEGAVRRAGGVPDYAETRAYVPKVIAAWEAARTLCLTPPLRATDGCLFRQAIASK